MARTTFLIGSISGAVSVALGAFGAHSLQDLLSEEMFSIFETGVRYQFYHTLALFACGWALERYDQKILRLAVWLFAAGIVFFSGSLYLLAITSSRGLGAVTPIGGISFIGGWIALGLGLWNAKK